MERITKKIWHIGSLVNENVERFSAFIHILVVIFVVFICSQAIACSIIYLQLLNEEEIYIKVFEYINIWSIIPTAKINNDYIYSNLSDVKMKIEFFMNMFIALSGILLSLVTFISYFRKNVSIRRKSCFKKKEIFDTGKDDLKIMCKYFKGASFVAIHSHSFDWLNKNE